MSAKAIRFFVKLMSKIVLGGVLEKFRLPNGRSPYPTIKCIHVYFARPLKAEEEGNFVFPALTMLQKIASSMYFPTFLASNFLMEFCLGEKDF